MTFARVWLRRPVTWVLATALFGALFGFRHYGLTWDEPLYYQYAEALGYAYTPANWLSGHFDITQAYGPSADDHKTRGPAYLLLARVPAQLLQAAGLSLPDSWHLINSVTFILGALLVYGISRRIAGEGAAALGAGLFASQPLLWGHAFINPKDIPFMVIFAGTVWSGWRMVDHLARERGGSASASLGSIVLPAVLLGLATSIRVLGPLAGLLVVAYWFARRPNKRDLPWLCAYAGLAVAVMLATWPYLWEGPWSFASAFALMAQNPTVLPVLFGQVVYPANELPLRYLPFYMAVTLTEPVWPLALLGAGLVLAARAADRGRRLVVLLLLAWLLIPPVYVILQRPPMYDGMRHFLFVLPPAFILAAAALDLVIRRLRSAWQRATLCALVLLPGIIGIAMLHPYEYTYYNALVGGTGGVFRKYETDYWLTCYKDAIEELESTWTAPARVYVHREASVAAPYAAANLTIIEERAQRDNVRPGDFVLVNTRTNEDLRTYRGNPEYLSVGRLGATFCVIKRIQ
jgi:hypothetical protein